MAVIKGWDACEEAAKRATGGNFVRLENDGDKVVVFFLGDPLGFEVFWDGSAYVDFTDEHRKAGKTPSTKFKQNVYLPADKAVKVLEVNSQTFKTILGVKKKYGFGAKTFEIIRQGKKGDTKTTYSVLPDADLSPEHRAIMEALPLHDLEKAGDDDDHKGKGGAAGGDGFSTFAGSGKPDDPIPAKEADALTARLKILPKAQIDRFLIRLAVEKVKLVKNKDLELAKAFTAFLEGKGPDPDAKQAPAAAAAENDPFV